MSIITWKSVSISDEMQINTTMKYHFIHSRMAKIKIPKTPDAGEDVEQPALSYIAGGM